MITSTSNEHIKFVRKLKDKKFRTETGLCYLEGTRIVYEAVENRVEIQELIYCSELISNDAGRELIDKANKNHIDLVEVNSEVFRSISLKDGPQGIAGIVKQRWGSVDDFSEGISGLWLGVDQVADPGNLGTMVRTIDAVGGKGILLIGNCTDPYDPIAIRASMGAIFTVQIIKIDQSAFIDLIIEKGIQTLGTSDSAPLDYRKQIYPKNMIIVMGSERQGLSEKLMQHCSLIVKIPMVGQSDSLNLSVAAGIILYEAFRQNEDHHQKATI